MHAYPDIIDLFHNLTGNGFIEGEEMDKFFRDVIHMAVKGQVRALSYTLAHF